VNGCDVFSTFELSKISRLFDRNLSPSIGGALGQRVYLKNSAVENCFDDGDAFPRFKLPIISCLFVKSLSPGIGGALSQKPLSQQWQGLKKIINSRDVFSTLKVLIISCLLDKQLSLNSGRVILFSPGHFFFVFLLLFFQI
jgi:hypothetical protein